MTHQYTITNGPSKFDFMLALFDSNNSRQRAVRFSFESRKSLHSPIPDAEVRISQVSRENGSGESWLFEGYSTGGQKVKGYFSTMTRRGWIEVE